MNQKSTVKPTQTSHVRETVVLATENGIYEISKPAPVTDIREWLMRDVMSTPYAVLRS